MDRSNWLKLIKDVWWSGWAWVGECFFWYRPNPVVLDQRPLNGCVCLSQANCVSGTIKLTWYWLLMFLLLVFNMSSVTVQHFIFQCIIWWADVQMLWYLILSYANIFAFDWQDYDRCTASIIFLLSRCSDCWGQAAGYQPRPQAGG